MLYVDDLVQAAFDQFKKEFVDENITVNNILEVIAIIMNIAEKWRKGTLTGPEKRAAVLAVAHELAKKYAAEDDLEQINELIDRVGPLSIELVMWLSSHKSIIKAINSSPCCAPVLSLCKK